MTSQFQRSQVTAILDGPFLLYSLIPCCLFSPLHNFFILVPDCVCAQTLTCNEPFLSLSLGFIVWKVGIVMITTSEDCWGLLYKKCLESWLTVSMAVHEGWRDPCLLVMCAPLQIQSPLNDTRFSFHVELASSPCFLLPFTSLDGFSSINTPKIRECRHVIG